MRALRNAGVVAQLAGLLVVFCPTATRGADGFTLGALQLAYQREVCAQHQYDAYAERAWMEGHLGVRNLFQTLSIAEDVHARRFAFLLQQMDVTPVPKPDDFTVGTTPQNLRAAIEGEVFERVAAYDRFKQYARDELSYDALAAFRYACGAEATHAAMMAEALVRLSEMTDPRAYYLCPGCGCVAAKSNQGHCDCGGAGRHFAVIYDKSPAPNANLAGREAEDGQR